MRSGILCCETVRRRRRSLKQEKRNRNLYTGKEYLLRNSGYLVLPNRAPWVAITSNLQHLMMIILMIIIYFIKELPGDMTGISNGG